MKKRTSGAVKHSNFNPNTKQHMKKTGNFSTKKCGMPQHATFSGTSKKTK